MEFKGSGIGVGRVGESGRWPVVHSWCLDGGTLRIDIGALDGFICDNAKFIMSYKVYYAPTYLCCYSEGRDLPVCRFLMWYVRCRVRCGRGRGRGHVNVKRVLASNSPVIILLMMIIIIIMIIRMIMCVPVDSASKKRVSPHRTIRTPAHRAPGGSSRGHPLGLYKSSTSNVDYCSLLATIFRYLTLCRYAFLVGGPSRKCKRGTRVRGEGGPAARGWE